MNITDPIADMLTRIRNGLIARQDQVRMPSSQLKQAIARILKEEGFIKDFELVKDSPHPTLRIWLRYTEKKQPVITGLKRVSKPGRRVYVGKESLPRVLGGMGVAIISTSQGIMTDKEARQRGVGGEVVGYVW